MLFVTRLKQRVQSLDIRLSLLQIGAIAALILIYCDFWIIYRFYTINYFYPPTAFLIKKWYIPTPVAPLPILVLIRIILGEGKTPKFLLDFENYIRSVLFQSRRFMAAAITVAAASTLSAWLLYAYKTPPYYATFFQKLINRPAADDFSDSFNMVEKLKPIDEDIYKHFSNFIEISENYLNLGSGKHCSDEDHKNIKTYNSLLRQVISDGRWAAYGHYAQAQVRHMQCICKFSSTGDHCAMAISAYDKVINSCSPLVTEAMKSGAKANKANVYAEDNKYAEAENILSELHKDDPNNLSIWSNLIMAYLGQGKPDKALEEADKLIEAFNSNQAQGNTGVLQIRYTHHYKGLAYWYKGDYTKAKIEFQDAFYLDRSDDCSRVVYAYACVLNGDSSEAVQVLGDKYPDLVPNDLLPFPRKATDDNERVTRLVWTMARKHDPTFLQTARLGVFLKNQSLITTESVEALKCQAYEKLQDEFLYEDFLLAPKTREIFCP